MIKQTQFPFEKKPKPNLNLGLTLFFVVLLMMGSTAMSKDDRVD
jgi:hypothetical protein